MKKNFDLYKKDKQFDQFCPVSFYVLEAQEGKRIFKPEKLKIYFIANYY